MICEYCGKEFEGRKAGAVFCSKRCKDNASKERRGIPPVIEQEKVCTACGELFTTVYRKQKRCDRCKCGGGGPKRNPAETYEKRNPGFAFVAKDRNAVTMR